MSKKLSGFWITCKIGCYTDLYNDLLGINAMNLNLPDKVVPGFPYEGALFWFFSGRKDETYRGGHPYYVTLYGPDHQLL